MFFYELTHPDYISDMAHTRHNPVCILANEKVPSIICEDCGIWSGSERLRRKFNFTTKAKQIINEKFIPVSRWNETINDLALELEISDTLLEPGTELGFPRGLVTSIIKYDFTHPFPGQMWVKRSVVDALINAEVTGVEFSPVELSLKKTKNLNGPMPEDLWELVVNGRAWRKGSSYENILVCEKCNRYSFPDPEFLEVDKASWDGSDFFTLDLNPNIIIVSEKVQRLLKQMAFSNYLCKPI